MVEWGAALKLLIFLALAANLFVPWGIATTLSPPALMIWLPVRVSVISTVPIR